MEKTITKNKEKMKRNMDEMENKMDEKNTNMKNKMDENKEEIQKIMKELQNSLSSMIFHALDERIPKRDIKMKGTCENKGSIHVEQTKNNKQFPSGFNSNIGVNYSGGPKLNFPNIELKKFDGAEVFTYKKYFEVHNIMDNKKMIHIKTLNFEIKPYQRYQWVTI